MSLSTLLLSPVTRAPGAGGASSIEPARAWPRHGHGAERIEGTRAQGVHRHALADAMLSLLGPRAGSSTDAAVDGSAGVGDATHGGDSGETREAVFRFAHALMKDLRQLGGDRTGEGAPMRHGWGRRDWSDLPQRVQDLASAIEVRLTQAGVSAVAPAPAAAAPVLASAAREVAVAAEPAAAAAVDARAPKPPATAPATAQGPLADAAAPAPAAPGAASTPALATATATAAAAAMPAGASDGAQAQSAAAATPARAGVGTPALPAALAPAAAQASAEERAVQAQASGVKDLPQPVTPISAAVHLMQVPSSQLLAAFSALRAAVPQADLWKAEGGELDQLGDFLQRLSATLEPGVDAPPRAGWLLHETA
jgi:hypothetical protein